MDALFANILRGLISFSIGIYITLGVATAIYLGKFITSMNAWHKAVFGLERRIAQRKLITSVTGLTLLIFLLVGQFILTTIIGPQMPLQQMAEIASADPGNDQDNADEESNVTTEGQIDGEPGQPDSLPSECVEEVLEITSPEDGERVSGTVEIIGTVNITDFGSYKYEYATLTAENWITIAAGNQLKLDETLGLWYTSALDSGWYLLQLVPLNNRGEELTPCIISVEVLTEE